MLTNLVKSGILTTAFDAMLLAIVDDHILKHDYCCLTQPKRIHTASIAANKVSTGMMCEGGDEEGNIKLGIFTDVGPLGKSQEIDNNAGRLNNSATKMSVPAFTIDESV